MSSAWRTAEEGDLEEDVDTILEQQEAGENTRDSILFLIDCSPSMFVRKVDEIPFISAIRCVSATMKNKIISSEDDLTGVLLYNTGKDRNVANFKGIYMLQRLDVPDAERIRELDGIVKDVEAFKGTVGAATEPAIMGNVFWSCSSAFGPLKKKVGSKRVFLFTNNDSPHADNVALQRAAKIRARDLSDLGIFIELFNLDPVDRKFDLQAFYADILPPLQQAEEEGEETLSQSTLDSSEKFAELMAKVRRRESRKRALGKMPMILGNGMALSIRIYSLFMEAKKGGYVWMDESSGKLAKPVTEWIGQSTGASLSREELQFYYDFGGAKAIFTKSELASVKDLGQPGLTILGFRPRSWLKTHYNVTHSSFIFPDETVVRGSIVTFTAMLQGMLELDQLAIGAYVARRTVAPKIVALLPQAEEIDPETGAQVKPPGMSLIILPFAEDLRQLRHEGSSLEPVGPAIVDKAKEIIAKLTISGGFDPEAFENPVIQRHYAVLQALALDQELDEQDMKDSIMPDSARMQKRAGGLIEEFIQMIPACDTPSNASKAAPRKRTTGSASSGDAPEIDVAAIANDRAKLSKLTVPVLKAYADSKGIKGAKLKADLIDQIMNLN